MSEGKAISQAGHAYIGAILSAKDRSPNEYRIYTSVDVATKICLDGGREEVLLTLHEKLQDSGIPSFLVYDHGHVEPPHFDGSRILTALGVGPVSKAGCPRYLKRIPLWTGKAGQGGAP